jgi:hypothetical protein
MWCCCWGSTTPLFEIMVSISLFGVGYFGHHLISVFSIIANNVFFPKRITSYYLVFRFAQSTIQTTKTNMAIYWFSRIPIITSWLYGYMLAISNPETEKQIWLYGYILAISHPGIIESRNKKHIWIYGYTNDGLPRTQASSPTSGVYDDMSRAMSARHSRPAIIMFCSS